MHESYLTVFFDRMNRKFPNDWCVLHSYETLPQFSESDVDMAFSGTSISALEELISEVAKTTGWRVYQKLWYDVESCFYYVLKQNDTDVFLALDFLIDNDGLGKYGFKTSVLTNLCLMTPEKFPIPNSEVAFSYKLIKRIVKKKSLADDKRYLMEQYGLSDSNKIDMFLTKQFGNPGNEMIRKFLTVEDYVLANDDMNYLNNKRGKLTSNFANKTKNILWQIRRITNRVFYPSGMIIYVPQLKTEQLELLKDELESRLDILFRYICLNPNNSFKYNFTSFVGSTLVLCPVRKYNPSKLIRYNWGSKKSFELKFENTNDIKLVAENYSSAILKALSDRIVNRVVSIEKWE